MMLQPVAGPLPLAPRDAAYPTVVPTHGIWVDALGGILAVSGAGSTSAGDVSIIKPDGTIFRIGHGSRAWLGMGWSYDDALYLESGVAPPQASRIGIQGLVEQDLITTPGLGSFAVMSDRWLTFDGNNVVAHPFSGGSSVERAITTLQPGPGRIFPADLSLNRWWLVGCGNGKLYLYDARSSVKAEVAGRRTAFEDGLFPYEIGLPAYSRKHDLFSILYGGDLYLFADAIKAATVSEPEITLASAGKPGLIVAILTGDHGEPCPGRKVTFSVSDGDLPRPTVVTNAAGVAQTEYLAPQNHSEDNLVTATLVE